MGKIFAVLFVLLVGGFSAVFARNIPYKKRSSLHRMKDSISIAKDAAERGEAGVYKLEIAITGDLEEYVPTIFYMGKFNRKSSSSEFTALADSLLRRKDVDITPADSFMISATYLDNPSLFYAPFVIETPSNSHGCTLIVSSLLPLNEMAAVKIAIKGYYNSILVKEVEWHSSPSRDRENNLDTTFELGNFDMPEIKL